MEAPGLVPAVDGVGLGTKQAQREHSQRERQRRRKEEEESRRERSVVDRGLCFGVIAEAVDDHRRKLKATSRGLDLCGTTPCSDVADVRTWVMGVLEEQQAVMLRIMDAMVQLGQVMSDSRHTRGAAGEVVDRVGTASGGHGVQVTDASAHGDGG